MRTSFFKGLTSLPTVECAADGLEADVTVMSMTMYSVHDNNVVAAINILDSECSTSGVYSACVVSSQDKKRTKLVSIVPEAVKDEVAVYGCNLTVFRQGKGHIVSWSTSVRLPMKGSSEDVMVMCMALYYVDKEILSSVNIVEKYGT
ncbi:hypothetical protein C0Q70_12251 [Pomacea canaliculata]|uniref:Uncharacterized protein n=1 Tax=Pomacea canaliculata TaxID=400727 RepID=A0A2T7P103_POMCA|nr:hypothetical protein C0Q70_12251 [Pomacea canaliculata]